MGRQVFKNDLGGTGGHFYCGYAGNFSPGTVNGYFDRFGRNGVAGMEHNGAAGEEQAGKDNSHGVAFFVKWNSKNGQKMQKVSGVHKAIEG